MKKKERFDYFAAISKQAGYAEEIALNLQSALAAGDLGKDSLMKALHTIENDADEVNHGIMSHLLNDFVVPLERDSISNLAYAMDDVVDNVEDIAIKAYAYDCHGLELEGPKMVDLMCSACSEFKQAAEELRNYTSQITEISVHMVQIQSLESQADALFVSSVRSMYTNKEMDAEYRHIAHAMLSAVEEAMDSLERASELMMALVAENM